MHGVSRLTVTEDVMLISYSNIDTLFMVRVLQTLAAEGLVVDMISQTAPVGKRINFCFSASFGDFNAILKALGEKNMPAAPMLSSGYTKINLFGESMHTQAGVASRGLQALVDAGVDIAMITTSDLDYSLLVHQQDADSAVSALKSVYSVV